MSTIDLYCYFCGNKEEEVNYLIEGDEAYICDQCVNKANLVINEKYYLRLKKYFDTKNIKAILTDTSVTYIGIANPRLAPYGSSAIKFMESEGVLNSLQTKLVYTENVAQTLQLVLSKNAELGFVSKSLVASQGVENFSLVYELPRDYNSNLVVTSGAVLKKDSHPMTLNYLDMLSSSDYKHIWETFEYEMLGS